MSKRWTFNSSTRFPPQLFPGKLIVPREYWRQIAGWPKYEVSTLGNVRSSKLCKVRVLAKSTTQRGYLNVSLYADGQKSFLVHHLVLKAFVSERPPGMECRHKNGIKTDNRLRNLAWGTPTENAADKAKHGTSLYGEKAPWAKLTTKDVEEIRESTEKLRVLAGKYGVTKAQIQRIRNGTSWKHLKHNQKK